MKYVYASRTGNVESLINKLGLDAIRIEDGSESVDDDFILFTYTDGYGDVPMEVDTFLAANSMRLRGVVVSGSLDYGDAYCKAGDVIAEQYDVPVLYKVENDGTDDDVKAIAKALQ
ncbi:MAG: class Ib ribonucleoside-diphosphate reductase assembly flavoprotein NrdI [Erysipelotrichaceae bacterium]|nr:class Ib ribonucleoside-diphosphate reductase assembly flavoprotein NrdI [Erysipelotrichaceae bacterium]